ncbi:Uncharacterized protein LC1Hm_1352 [Halomicrobium sp. LC1Hm]|nr:Uncharacterized protein LC1Hm_1352 [Halomicrobium sp. LC1Hm]
MTDRTTAGTEYRAIVERYDARPNRCTIFRATDEHAAWVTADEATYVDLALVR